MRYNNLPERCRSCRNMKAWGLSMNGNHYCACKRGKWNFRKKECDSYEAENPMTEYISKEAAIERMSDALIGRFGIGLTEAYSIAEDGLNLPKADVAHLAHGEWIHMGCGVFECDKCGERISTNVYVREEASDRFKFCPNCGAKMDGEE